MTVPKLKTKTSAEDYLEAEKSASVRSEYLYGEVYAMAGASDRHHRISANVFIELDSHLRNSSKCDAFMAEMKLKVNDATFYYPDVFVACDEPTESEYYRQEPVLIVEVTSPTTREIDRREKLRAYQQMPSVQEYVIIEQEKIHVEIHRRQPNGTWITYFYNRSDMDAVIEFESVGLKTNLEAIYQRVNLPEPPVS